MEPAPTNKQVAFAKRLSLIGFWIIGIVNNYTYVVILSAAYDLLDDSTIPSNSTMPSNSTNLMCYDAASGRECNAVSTGVILLANIIPTLIVKTTLSWCLDYISYHIRVAVCIISNLASLLILATSYQIGLILLGVVFASIEAGLGEVTFLSLTAMYSKSEVAAWSSGTGAAGIAGSLSYLILTFFLSPRTAIFLMVVVPFIMGIAFWGFLFIPQLTLLKKKLPQIYRRKELERTVSEEHLIKDDEDYDPDKGEDGLARPSEDISFVNQKKTWKENITQFLVRTLFIRKLLRYMCPLFLVYVFEYMINQGLFELLYYKNACIDQNMQYRVYQFLYQFGVFVSRSSVIFFRIKYLWLMSFLQAAIFVLFYLEAEFMFIPFILITFCVILFEGLLGGATYANAFYRVRNEIESKRVEFSMGVVSIADSFGITLAAFLSIAIHNSICRC